MKIIDILSNYGTSIKLFGIIVALALVQMTWVKGRINSLVDENIEQAKVIEQKELEIAILEKNKFIEEGLNEIINEQHKDYIKLLEEYEELKNKKVKEIKTMTVVERDEGLEIDLVWDIYRGIGR